VLDEEELEALPGEERSILGLGEILKRGKELRIANCGRCNMVHNRSPGKGDVKKAFPFM